MSHRNKPVIPPEIVQHVERFRRGLERVWDTISGDLPDDEGPTYDGGHVKEIIHDQAHQMDDYTIEGRANFKAWEALERETRHAIVDVVFNHTSYAVR